MELNGLVINFLGDSITEGVGASKKENVYHAVLKRKYGIAEARNYGIGGTRIAPQHKPSTVARWDLDFCGRVKDMAPDADAVVVFGGTNDFGHGDAPLGLPSDRTADTFTGACHVLFRSLIEKYPDKPIFVMTPCHRLREEFRDGEHHQKGGEYGDLKRYVEILREVAEYYSLPVIDLYAESGLQPNIPVLREKYMPDGLHPSDAGHERIADRIAAALRAY